MHFSNPEMLWLLWLVLPLGLLLRIAAARKTAALHRFADPELLEQLRPPSGAGRMTLRRILLVSGLIAIVFALAGPRWGFQWEDVERRGVDLVVALDLSRSMLAADAKPDRLTAAKREIRDLMELLGGDRVALVAFAGTSFIQCPLTLDYHAFELFLDEMDPDWVPIGGTDLAGAVRTSIEAFPENERSGRAVLLITDGEDHSGKLQLAAEDARKAGVHVFVVGMGDPQGAPIPDGHGGFVKEGGKVVLSKLDEPALKELTLTTEGTYVRSVAGDLDLRRIYLEDIKGTLQARELSSSRQRRWEERFQWALLPALLLLVLEGLTGPPRRKDPRMRAAAVGALALFLLPTQAMAWSLFGSDDPARQGKAAFEKKEYDQALEHWTEAQVDDPADRRLDYNIGQALYRLERFPDAEQAFLAATATDRTALAADAFYGAGNAAFQQGKFPDAIKYYEQSLELRPGDEDAEHNADLAQRRYEEMMEQAEQQQQEQEQQEPPPEQTENDEPQEGEEGESEQQQQQQEQQQGQSAEEQEQDGQAGESEEKQEQQEQDEGQGEQDQKEQQEMEEQAGGAAEAADIDRSGEPEDSTPAGAVSSNTEEAEADDRPASVIEGALSEEQAEELLKALKADEQNRRKQRTEREARRGRKAAGKDW
mgnify:FL=1